MVAPMIRNNMSGLKWFALMGVACVAGFAQAPQGQAQQPPAAQPPAQTQQAAPQPAAQAPVQQPPAAAQPAAPPAAQPPAEPADSGSIAGLSLQNVNLTEVVDFLARELKINYIMDSRVKGSVTLNTYGPLRDLNRRELLDTILRINGAAMVQTGSVYRIVPLADLASMPLNPQVDEKNIPEDDRAMLNLIFLKYANAEELSKLLGEFVGKEAKVWSYPPANLLLVLDGRRSMKRTMELVSLFDSDALARQRVRLFEVQFSRPSDIAKELEDLMKSISMGKDLQSIRFVPVDRINLLIAVAPNPGVFSEVETWLKKLDVKVKSAAGKTDTYVYRVKYGRADLLSMSITMLFSQMYPGYGMGMGGGMYGGGMYGGGMYGGGMYGGGMYGGGMYGGGMYGGAGMGGAYGGGVGMGANPYLRGQAGQQAAAPQSAGAAGAAGAAGVTGGAAGNMTGQFLGMGGFGMPYAAAGPRVVPNIMDNSLLILATGEEYESILKLLDELDVPPRQVLIEARIYEVTLTGAFSSGVTAYLRRKGEAVSGGPGANATRQLVGSINEGINLSFGALIGQSRELFVFLNSSETRDRTKVISAPSIIATDSIPANINVGTEVPTLQSQAVTDAQQGGSSLFANTISNRRTGVTLNITARVNPSGVVTLQINQEVSAPQAPEAGSSIQSPSFSQRTISTQVTVNDGDMIAIGGIINETSGDSSVGVPLLHKIPYLGAAFGNKAANKARTELVVFMTPRVIYDTNMMNDASDELSQRLRRLQRVIRESGGN